MELTTHQKQFMELVCLGKTNPEISQIMGIAIGTVKCTLVDCRRKLQASNKTLAVAKYLAPDKFKK